MNNLKKLFIIIIITGFTANAGLSVEKPPKTEPKKNIFSEERLQYDFANGLFARGLYNEAISEYQNFIEKFSSNLNIPEALFHLGEAYFAIGQYKKAEETLDNFLKKYPKHKFRNNAILKFSCSQFERRDFKTAIVSLESLLNTKTEPEILYPTLYYLGRSYSETGDHKKAEETLLKVITGKNKFYPLALYELSEIYSAKKDYKTSEKYLRMFLGEKIEGNFESSAMIRLAEALRGQEKYEEAESVYKKLAESQNSFNKAQALLGSGWIKIKLKRFEEAEKMAREALQLNVKNQENALRYLLGVSLFHEKKHAESTEVLLTIKNGRYAAPAAREIVWNMLGAAELDKALQYAKAYLKAFPKHAAGTAEFLIATTLFRKTDYAGAAQYFLKAREAEKNSYAEDSAFQLALAYERLGDNQKAAEAYAYFIKKYPKSNLYNTALIGWGDILIKLKDFSLAVSAFDKIIESRNALPAQKEQAFVQQAVCYYELKKYENMDKCYRNILNSFPQSNSAAEALYWVAWGEQNNKNYANASARYKEFLKKYPKHEFADKSLYRMGMSEYQAGNEGKSAEIFYDIVINHPAIKISQSELLWLGSYFMQTTKLKEAGDIYETLLKRHPDGEIRAITLYYLAEIQRKRNEYAKAIENYKRLAIEKGQRFQSLANFGLGMCLRKTGKPEEAKKAYEKVFFPAEDPLMASLHLELGLIEKETGTPEEAIKHFMRVGLLYDEINVCGEALWEAGQLFEKQGQKQKAVTCYKELTEGAYGEKYTTKSNWSKLAKERLSQLFAP